MPLFNPDYLARLVYAMPENSGLHVSELAQRLGRPSSTLGRELNPDDEGAKLGLAHFVQLTAETGDFGPLDYIESFLGRVAFALPRVVGTAEVLIRLGAASKEFGDVVQQIADDLADGSLDQHERALKEISEVAQALAALRAAVLEDQAAKREPKLRAVGPAGR